MPVLSGWGFGLGLVPSSNEHARVGMEAQSMFAMQAGFNLSSNAAENYLSILSPWELLDHICCERTSDDCLGACLRVCMITISDTESNICPCIVMRMIG